MQRPVISIKWKDGASWRVFALDEINHMPRNHAIRLFSGNVQTIAKEGNVYIVNRQELKDKYAKQGSKVYLFGELEKSEKPLQYVGFIKGDV